MDPRLWLAHTDSAELAVVHFMYDPWAQYNSESGFIQEFSSLSHRSLAFRLPDQIRNCRSNWWNFALFFPQPLIVSNWSNSAFTVLLFSSFKILAWRIVGSIRAVHWDFLENRFFTLYSKVIKLQPLPQVCFLSCNLPSTLSVLQNIFPRFHAHFLQLFVVSWSALYLH